jgi:hypothetical protein
MFVVMDNKFSVCLKPGKSPVMYMYDRGIAFSFVPTVIRLEFGNYSDSVVFF